MWKSEDKTITSVKKIKFGNKLFCVHNLLRNKGTNTAVCTKCNAMFLVNCEYKPM